MVGASGASGGSDALLQSGGGGLIDVGSNLYGGRVPYVRPDGKVVDLKIKREGAEQGAAEIHASPRGHPPDEPSAAANREGRLAPYSTTRSAFTEALHARARRDNVEVWVASPVPRALPGGTVVGLDFLAGDCRNGVRTTITDAQVNYLAQQFDENILLTESEVFSVAIDRDGSHFVPANAGNPVDGAANPHGDGDDTVVLIDNVRDDNFYDLNNSQSLTRIAGFFSSGLNELFDRNIMTIDRTTGST